MHTGNYIIYSIPDKFWRQSQKAHRRYERDYEKGWHPHAPPYKQANGFGDHSVVFFFLFTLTSFLRMLAFGMLNQVGVSVRWMTWDLYLIWNVDFIIYTTVSSCMTYHFWNSLSVYSLNVNLKGPAVRKNVTIQETGNRREQNAEHNNLL